MKIEQIEKLIGKRVIVNGSKGVIGGVHLYINANGEMMSIRVYIPSHKIYYRIDEVEVYQDETNNTSGC